MNLLFDIEANGLDPTQIFCIVAIDIDTKDIHSFGCPDIEKGYELLQKADKLIGHNIIGYDIPALKKVADIDLSDKKIVDKELEINSGSEAIEVEVSNTGDRPIQVGSHYHFFETNEALKFSREKSKGMRLDIISGTAIRFEPGQTKTVNLISFHGDRKVYGFNKKIMGDL